MARPGKERGITTPHSLTRVLIGRREFLRRLSALSGAAASSSALRALAATPNPSTQLHVIIAGAGLAGLVAAYELEQFRDDAENRIGLPQRAVGQPHPQVDRPAGLRAVFRPGVLR